MFIVTAGYATLLILTIIVFGISMTLIGIGAYPYIGNDSRKNRCHCGYCFQCKPPNEYERQI